MTETIDEDFVAAVRSRERIAGFTHNFYRYPARFSPLFARAAISAFSSPGDVVLDPFMGGGTSLVEACAAGRCAVGTDLNSLSVFVAKVKTLPYSDYDLLEISAWVDLLLEQLNLRRRVERDSMWLEKGYHKNINCKKTWPIRKLLEIALSFLEVLPTDNQRLFARCLLLKTAQWALDCRMVIPTASGFRDQLRPNLHSMIKGAREFRCATARSSGTATCLHRSAVGLEEEATFKNMPRPKLIITSPPYPGVHVLYHRWQVQGRRETPAPYWIANSLDGEGASFYTFGRRKQPQLTNYYNAALHAFSSLAKVVTEQTMVVQMIAFSDPVWQLPEYLRTMEQAGFAETTFDMCSDSADKRVWRNIPNRKFYADQKGETTSSKEVVLFHRLMS